MKTTQYQVQIGNDEHWINVTPDAVEGLRKVGYVVRELVSRDEAEAEIAASRTAASTEARTAWMVFAGERKEAM